MAVTLEEQDNIQRERSELTRKMCVISFHMIHKPLGTDDVVQSLRERHRKAVMGAWCDSDHLAVNGRDVVG